MRRSILAVVAGYLASAATIFAVIMLSLPLFTDVPLENRAAAARSLGSPWYLFELAVALPAGMLGGYLAATLARQREMAHAVGLAGLFGAMGVVSVVSSAGFKPAWHDVAVTLAGMVGCLFGGWFRAARRGASGQPDPHPR